MIPIIVASLVFAAAFLAIFAVNSVLTDLFPSDQKQIKERLRNEMLEKQRTRAKASHLFKEPSEIAFDPYADDDVKHGWYDRLKMFVEQSGMDIGANRLLIIASGSGVAVGALAWLFGGIGLGMILAAMTAAIPFLFVYVKRQRRLESLLAQIPDAFDLMSRIIRAGQTMTQAMQSVGDEFEAPVAEEFGYCYEQQNLGLDTETAMRDLARRTGLLELRIFVVAVLVHRQTGGNLAELLDKLAAIVRDRFRVRGLIKTLTAEGRVQASVLLALPIFMYLIMLFLNREYALILFQHPILPIGSAISLVLGWLWIRKIVNFDV